MRWSGVGVGNSKAAGASTHLRVVDGSSLGLALPELRLAGARGVTVGRRWAKGLLLLMLADEEQLGNGSEE